MTEKELIVKSSDGRASYGSGKNTIDTISIGKIGDDGKDWFLREPSNPCKCYEDLRWKCNLCTLHNPCGSMCNNNSKCLCIPKMTISDMIIFLLLVIWIVVPLMYNINDYSTDNDSKLQRVWVLALAFGQAAERNYILALLFTQRNTIIRIIFGLPFERAVGYHETMARFAAAFTWVHFILLMVYWGGKKGMSIAEELGQQPALTGLLGFICVDLGSIIAYEDNRRKCFEFFMKTHWILMPAFVVLMFLHVPANAKILFAIITALQVIDGFVRLYLSFGKPVKIKSIEYIEANDAVKITWNKKNFSFSPGQYIFVCIPSISFTQWHPFTISCSSNPNDNNGDFTLHINCGIGDWVEKLRDLVKGQSENGVVFKNMKVYIEGPYGRPAIPILKYKSIILMSGGIGITPMISLFAELIDNIKMNKDNKEAINTKRVHFVWSVKQPGMVQEFDNIIRDIVVKFSEYENKQDINLKEEFNLNGVVIKISYYITRMGDDETEQNKYKEIYSNLSFNVRPSAKVIIEEAEESEGSECIGILGCGPMPMIESIQNEAAFHKIHCHTEVFNI